MLRRRHRTSTAAVTAVIAALLALAALSLVGCSGGDSSSGSTTTGAPSAGSDGSGGWSMTDDVGNHIELDAAPKTIVASPAAAGALWEYGIEVDGVLGSTKRMDGTADPSFGLADTSAMTALVGEGGELNMEQLAALQPDLVITESWGDDDTFGLEPDQRKQIEDQIAPVAVIKAVDKPLEDVLARFADVGVSIADARGDGGAAEAARTKGEQALAASRASLQSATEGQDLKVMAVSGSPEQFYVARSGAYADLRWFGEAGVDMVAPSSPVGSEPNAAFWETLSWEEINKYHADVILADARYGSPEWAKTMIPSTAQQAPAFDADQVFPWEITYAFGYQNFAEVAQRLADELTGSKVLAPAT